MTLGSLVLMAMETAPVRPPSSYLASVSSDAGGELDELISARGMSVSRRWNHIILHGTDEPASKVLAGSHFVVDLRDGSASPRIHRTMLWQQQKPGEHVFLPGVQWNRDSIGVCLLGRLAPGSAGGEQLRRVAELVRAIQAHADVSSDRTYLASEIGQISTAPGGFPARSFEQAMRVE
jgi:hypothetical protein